MSERWRKKKKKPLLCLISINRLFFGATNREYIWEKALSEKSQLLFEGLNLLLCQCCGSNDFHKKKKKKPPAAGRRRFTVTNTRGNKTPLFESEPRKQEEPTERASAGFIPFWTSPASQGHIIHLIETQSQVKWSLTKLLLPRWWCRLKSISTLINRQPLVNKCVEPSGVSTEEISLPPSLSGCFNADAFLQDKLDSSGSQTRSVQTLQLDFAKREN